MMPSSFHRLALVAVLSLAISFTPRTDAWAQPNAGQPAPAVPPEPGTTAATFGDWTLRCQRSGTGDKAVRICEVVQAIQVQGQTGPIAQVALGRISPHEPMRVTTVLPASVAFPSHVQILLEDKAAPALELTWRRCFPDGCVADAPGPDAVLKRWREAREPGRIQSKNALGQEVTVPLSFRGFAQALDALLREPA